MAKAQPQRFSLRWSRLEKKRLHSLAEAREASRVALADVGIDSTLEERVKAALRSLLRD